MFCPTGTMLNTDGRTAELYLHYLKTNLDSGSGERNVMKQKPTGLVGNNKEWSTQKKQTKEESSNKVVRRHHLTATQERKSNHSVGANLTRYNIAKANTCCSFISRTTGKARACVWCMSKRLPPSMSQISTPFSYTDSLANFIIYLQATVTHQGESLYSTVTSI